MKSTERKIVGGSQWRPNFDGTWDRNLLLFMKDVDVYDNLDVLFVTTSILAIFVTT